MSASLSRTDKSPDERGITLQTLIVTAVLVLMAVVAGVVIVALTGSSSDDLEESGSELEGRCNSVEIFDPEVAARGERGENYSDIIVDDEGTIGLVVGTFRSERIGCIPVCVWDNSGDADTLLEPGEVQFHRNRFPGIIFAQSNPPAAGLSQFLFSGDRGEIATYAGPDNAKVFTEGNSLTSPSVHVAPVVDHIAVAPNQSECHTYDAAGNVLLG